MPHSLLALSTLLAITIASNSPTTTLDSPASPQELFVDPVKGKDSGKGTKRKPFRSVSAAVATLPEPLEESVTLHLLPGEYENTAGVRTSQSSLQLMHRMRPGVHVLLLGAEMEGRVDGRRA